MDLIAKHPLGGLKLKPHVVLALAAIFYIND